jgi:hypothetical protein
MISSVRETIMKALKAVLMAAVLGACTAENNQPPVKQGEFTADYKQLATCITLAWNRHIPGAHSLVVDEVNRLAVISMTAQSFLTTLHTETRVTETAPSRSSVAIHRARALVGDPDWVWQEVESCAASSSTAS